jgi:Fe-Mn family superoxide dismutase
LLVAESDNGLDWRPLPCPGVQPAGDVVKGRLYDVSSDLHEVGVIWLGQPLVVCDVYEHAFYVDYTNRKQEYVNKFVQFIDWMEVNSRFRALAI